jgi:hypothetical protein
MGPKLGVLTGFVVSMSSMSFTASANWQYTQWGMSPEQVVAASRGSAHLEQDNGALLPYLSASDKALLLAKGQIQIDNFNFIVGFYFDVNRRTLNSVFLTLPKCATSDAGRLKELLNAKYGDPRDRFYNLITKWVSPFAPDIISFTSGGNSNGCSIEYKPIPAGF